ncbi:hypothetical protein [Proteiniborus sp.]|uniref:hypothetical protein n=1 Tax=Proteiniborus sp. TaxID=2079015 RepID=UPI0033235F58
MGFMNIHDVLIMDNEENVYSLYMYEKKIKMIFYDKKNGKVDKKLILNNCLDEYDATISKAGIVYLVSQKIDGSIVLTSIEGERQEENILAEEFEGKLRNLNIRVINDTIHIIYCLESQESNNRFRIFHHSLLGDKWDTNIITDITIRDILNPINLIQLEDKLIIGYYDIVNDYEQVFINVYDLANSNWSNKIQLTTDNFMKLYLDMISNNKNEIDLCYSKLVENNFVITYEKYYLSDVNFTKTIEHALSNPANCMYPTFIYAGEILWVIWIEFNRLLSCYSDDGGISWSSLYSWESSKKDNFARYKFSTNNNSIANIYNFNYGFGTYGEVISFIGFGDIENAIEVPLKSKVKKKEDDEDLEDINEVEDTSEKEVISIEEGSQVKKEIQELKEKVEVMEKALKTIAELIENKISESIIQEEESSKDIEKIEDIEKRLLDIENYLNRRRRGFIR